MCPDAPEELVAFLEKYNGGETPETSFSMGGISSDIVAFYGVGDVKYSYSDIESIEYEDSTFLPIAFDSFGNQIVISLHDGSIGFVDHEKSNSVIRMAENLKTFFSLIDSKKVNPKHLKPISEREAELINRGKGDNISEALRELWQKEIEKYSAIHQEVVEI